MKEFSEHKGNPVAFRMFPGIPDTLRYIFVAVLLIAGFSVQTQIGYLLPGAIMLLCASLLLMFKGIDRRVFQYTVTDSNEWVKTERENIQNMMRIVKELRSWDKNVFEVSNTIGCLVFVLVLGILVLIIISGINPIVVVDAFVLFVPVFFSGWLKTDNRPPIMLKTNNIVLAATHLRNNYQEYDYSYYTLLSPVKNKVKPAPRDIKIKISPPSPSDYFLGIYGQCSLNNVSGTFYPYLYFVIVFRKGFGLRNKIKGLTGTSDNITREYTETSDAEVLVIRQMTTRTSGYQTKPADIARLLDFTAGVYEKYIK